MYYMYCLILFYFLLWTFVWNKLGWWWWLQWRNVLLRKAANYTRLVGPVHFGNEASAWSRDAWFTHMLCVGEELSRPGNLRDDVIFRKNGMLEGVELPLDDKQLKDCVEWIRRVWSSQDKPPTKITQADRKHLLIYSRSAKFRHMPSWWRLNYSRHWPVITHADENRGSKAFIGVCLCICVSVCKEPKRLSLQSPNLPHR